MDNVARLHPSRKITIHRVILTKQSLMQRTNEILCQRNLLHTGLLSHHLQTHVARRHLLNGMHVSLTYHLTKQQQNLRLAIRQRITLNVVAVVVKVHGKSTAQPLPILLR